MPTLLPLRRLYPRNFFANIFHLGRQLSFEMTLLPSYKKMASPSVRRGKVLKNSKGNAPIMGFQICCWFESFTTICNNQ